MNAHQRRSKNIDIHSKNYQFALAMCAIVMAPHAPLWLSIVIAVVYALVALDEWVLRKRLISGHTDASIP